MASVTANAIRHASRAAHQQLAEMGWRRKSPHLWRERGSVIHGIHFQASQFGESDCGSFTVNLVVTEPVLYEAWLGGPFPANPATAGFPVRERIGLLRPTSGDFWWEVTAESDLATLSTEVVDLLVLAQTAFFSHYESLNGMLTQLRSTGSLPGLHAGKDDLIHGLIAAMLGHRSEAEQVLRHLISIPPAIPAFNNNVRRAAKKVGIVI